MHLSNKTFFFSYIFRHEYQIFQKVCRLDYEIPEGFNATAQDLVKKLLVSVLLRRSCVHVVIFFFFLGGGDLNKHMFDIQI